VDAKKRGELTEVNVANVMVHLVEEFVERAEHLLLK
jgi:hypothetical protein